MTFQYDPERHRVVDPESKAVVYQSSKLLDAGAICPFVYEKDDFVVEFEALPVSEPWQYRWKGEDRVGRFTTCIYVIEPKLHGNFVQASKSRSGAAPDDKNYKNFRDIIVEGITAILKSSAIRMSQDPNFEIGVFPDVEVKIRPRLQRASPSTYSIVCGNGSPSVLICAISNVR